ncbi:MAG: FtsX-like permease family protein [Waddliaceae bacterium]
MDFFLAFRNLFRNGRRTAAVLLTVALGAGALFSFNGFISGVLDEYRDSTIHSHYGFGQINTKGYRDTVFEEPTHHWIDGSEQLQKFLLDLEEVEAVFPRASFSALLKNGKKTVSGLGQGIEAEKEADFFHSLNVEQGETLSGQPRGILLGRGLARALDVQPGDRVTVMATSINEVISSTDLVVTGIFHTGSIDFDSRMFRIQLKEAQRLLKTAKIELVSLALRDLSEWDRVAEQVEASFPELESTSFEVLDEVYYGHSVEWLKAQFRVVQFIILGIVLLGIFNTVSASILERKQEIGNFRANGESVFQVMKLILVEGVLLAAIGGFIGIAGSFIFLKLFVDQGLSMPPGPGMTRQFLVSFHFELPMLFFTLMLSGIASVIASFLAGIRVAKMPIAASLRAYS